MLDLSDTSMGDEGVASLVAQPTRGVLQSLEFMDLSQNQMTDAGCATLVSALTGGALPALKQIRLTSELMFGREENPAIQHAREAVHAVLRARAESDH